MVDAAASTSLNASLGAPTSHPSFSAVAPLCRRYPTQASALFQTYLDLKNGAAAWNTVEPIALSRRTQLDPQSATVQDLSTLSDQDAEQLVKQKLEKWKSGTSKLGLVHSDTANNGTAEGDELIETGIGAIKGRRKDAVSLILSHVHHQRELAN